MKKLAVYGFFVLVVFAALPPVAATAAAPIPYAALGDSYSAGEGNRTFDGSCHRSKRSDGAYPRILPSLVGYISAPDFHACTGAETPDIWKRAQPNRPGQQVQTSYLSSTDRLVTLTIGGNDLYFSPIVKRCLNPFKGDCSESKLAAEVDAKLATITAELIDVYTQVRARMDPDGYLLVAGYPHLFTLGPEAGCQLSISAHEAFWIDSLVNRGNARILAAVREARLRSGNVSFVPVVGSFAGHELCTEEQWLHDINPSPLEPKNLFQGSYHPNRSGQRAYANAFAEFLRKPAVRSALTATPSPRSACSTSSPGPGSSSPGRRHRGAPPASWSAPTPACRPAAGARP